MINKKITKIFLSSVLALCIACPCFLNSINKAYAEPSIESVTAQLQEQSAVLDRASANYGDALAEQEKAQTAVNSAQEKIDDCNVKINDLSGKLSVRARGMYRNGTSSILDFVLGASSFWELCNNLEILNAMNASDASMVSESKSLRREVESQKAVMDENLTIATNKANEAYEIAKNAQAIESNLKAQLDTLTEEQRAAAAAAAESSRSSGYTPSPSYDPQPQPYDPGSGSVIVARAQGELGKPYIWGAVGPAGYDCSGLVSYCVSGSHVRIGTTNTFMGWTRVSNPQPGDIVTTYEHCGIYVGGGSMIHAPQPGDVVKYGGVQGGMIYVRP